MKAGKFIQAWLRQEAAVTAILGAADAIRAWPAGAPQSTTGTTYLTYQVIAAEGKHTLDGPSGLTPERMQLNCWSKGPGGYSAAHVLSEAIKGTAASPKLNGYEGTLSGLPRVACCILENELDDEEPQQDASGERWYRVIQDYVIWIDE